MHCESPRKEGVYRIHCFPKLFDHGTLSFFIEYFMRLVFCKKSQQMLPLVVANFVYFPTPPAICPSRCLSSPLPLYVFSPPLHLLFHLILSFYLPYFSASFPPSVLSSFLFPLSPPLPPFLFTILTLSSCSPWLFKKPESFLPLDGPGECPA